VEAEKEETGFSMSDFSKAVEVAKTKSDMSGYRSRISARIETNQGK
jgi:hypothetical protein